MSTVNPVVQIKLVQGPPGPPGPGPTQSGTAVLVNGQVTVSTATITSHSTFFVMRQKPNASTAYGTFTVRDTDITVGAPGTFIIKSERNTTTIETNDVSTVYWVVIN